MSKDFLELSEQVKQRLPEWNVTVVEDLIVVSNHAVSESFNKVHDFSVDEIVSNMEFLYGKWLQQRE